MYEPNNYLFELTHEDEVVVRGYCDGGIQYFNGYEPNRAAALFWEYLMTMIKEHSDNGHRICFNQDNCDACDDCEETDTDFEFEDDDES